MNLRFNALAQVLAGGLLLAGCRHESVVPNPVADYFPVALGSYRTYAVTDSVWVGTRPTATTYQLRERVSEQFTDAAGQPAYRLVRSRRANASAGWVDDSVLVVQPSVRAVLLTRNNVRTVELIFPARADKGWNRDALSASPDTIISRNRFYTDKVATPYTVPATGSTPAKTYDNTVATYDVPSAQDNDGVRRRSGYQQVYAQGVGRIVRRRYSYYYYTTNPDGTENQKYPVVQTGATRYEALIDAGTL